MADGDDTKHSRPGIDVVADPIPSDAIPPLPFELANKWNALVRVQTQGAERVSDAALQVRRLIAVALVAATARRTREQVWAPPAMSRRERLRHCARHMLAGTIAVTLLFAVGGGWTRRAAPLFTATMPAALALFILWAMLQQVLFPVLLARAAPRARPRRPGARAGGRQRTALPRRPPA